MAETNTLTAKSTGRVTLPVETGLDHVLADLAKRWGADAVRNSDGTDLPENITELGLEVYSTLSPVRYDQKWIKAHPQFYPQKYLSTDPATSRGGELKIKLIEGWFDQQFAVDTIHDPKKWFEVMDRTIGQPVDTADWNYDAESGVLTIHKTVAYHSYTVNFLVYQIWDTTSMYNHVTNNWTTPPISLVNPWHPEVQSELLKTLDQWLIDNPGTNVVRFTSLAYHFTNNFTMMGGQLRSRYRDWIGYHDCLSTIALEDFAKEKGYALRPEDIVDEGFMNDVNRVPSQRYLEWMDFVQRKVAEIGREWVDVCKKHNRKTMMFFCDHWIGSEPYGKYFPQIGLDAIVNPCMNGVELRRIADIPTPIIREVRLYPYLFPLNLEGKPGFAPGGDPAGDCKKYWMNVRRAAIQNPPDRIGFGGYLSLAVKFPEFLEYVEQLSDEFRSIHDEAQGTKPACAPFKVGILNCWGKLRSWIDADINDWTKPYVGAVMECLSGMNIDVEFLSFDDILADGIPAEVGVIINMGEANTAWSGGRHWQNAQLVTMLREWVDNGGGFIGIGDPSAVAHQGRFFQLHDVLGVDRELGYGISAAKPPFAKVDRHFILGDPAASLPAGLRKPGVWRMSPELVVLDHDDEHIRLATHAYGKGRAVYCEQFQYSMQTVRLLNRMLYWAAGQEDAIDSWSSSNPQVECTAFEDAGKYVVTNISAEEQTAAITKRDGSQETVTVAPHGMRWMQI
ncbi:1,3-beta-galactosyl-N-acetylhexosamine phosphorylase [Candidatus Sumerlaeota bacterium]|nr:1,3-beta-galactosyl-N-acetylhexosamine phosphorylase [Candidatus Sumerlaeota bacterium]